jgi:hypothetical protein
MEAVDYFVLLMVVVAYLGWLLQGEHTIKPHDSKPEE